LLAAAAARINAGVDPSRLLLLTFGRAAAASLRDQLTGAVDRVITEPLARTFHSYAFGLLRQLAARRGQPAPRLLAGPEQDLLIRELLVGDAAGRGVHWPAALRGALRTRGFATALRDVLSRAYERGIDPVLLNRWGIEQNQPQWRSAAAFMQQYADVTELRDASLAEGASYDPAELIRAAITALRRDRELLAAQRSQYSHVFVDEYHDCDTAQEELLQLLTGGGRFVVVFADPDQSIYGFRGADSDCVRRFRQRFPAASGEPAAAVTLRTCHRSARLLVEHTRNVASRIKGPARHRELRAFAEIDPSSLRGTDKESSAKAAGVAAYEGRQGDENTGRGFLAEPPTPACAVHVARSTSHETALITAALREAHLIGGVAWESMAVIVRSASRSVATLRRGMLTAGIPVAVGRAQIPLAEQPAVAPLLALLLVALHPAALDDATAQALLLSELGDADPPALRRLRRALRRNAQSAMPPDVEPASRSLSTGGLLVAAIVDGKLLTGIEPRLTAPLRRIRALLEAAQTAATAPGATAETLLWSVWKASGLPQRWQQRSAAGAVSSLASAADRDLDAVIELFEAAAAFSDRMPGARLELFIEHVRAQQVPADVFSNARASGSGVRLLTAHAAKGLQWDVVVVAGVQEGVWPNLRLRGGVLGAADLVELAAGRSQSGAAARAAAYQQLLDEERRLFYVAVTRARCQLVVTATQDEENEPSRFLEELDPREGMAGTRREHSDAPALLTLSALVAELRREVTQNVVPDAQSAETQEAIVARRAAAAAVLAQLSAAGVPGAAPSTWWGLAPLSDPAPLIEPSATVPVSPSAVETFSQCGLRWMLERRAGGSRTSGPAQLIGTAVHEVAAAGYSATGPQLLALLRGRLAELDLGTGWYARRQREQAEQMVAKLARWLDENPRRFVAVEQAFAVDVGRARLRGRVDRLEADEQGRLFVVDFKTGSSAPSSAEVVIHPQLGAYQLAVSEGGFDVAATVTGSMAGSQAAPGIGEGDCPGAGAPRKHSTGRGFLAEPVTGSRLCGGAALVQLGTAKTAREQLQPSLDQAPNPKWPIELIEQVAHGMADAVFTATANSGCDRCPVRSACPLHTEQTTTGRFP